MNTTHEHPATPFPPSLVGAGRGKGIKEVPKPRPHYQEIADLEFAERLNRRRAPRKSTERAIRFTQGMLVALAVVSVLTTLPKAIKQAAHDVAQHEQEAMQ